MRIIPPTTVIDRVLSKLLGGRWLSEDLLMFAVHEGNEPSTKAKIASRHFAKAAAQERQAVQVLLDRPTDEKTRQDRLMTLMGKTKALKSGSEI